MNKSDFGKNEEGKNLVPHDYEKILKKKNISGNININSNEEENKFNDEKNKNKTKINNNDNVTKVQNVEKKNDNIFNLFL